jgi:hypothetical protein
MGCKGVGVAYQQTFHGHNQLKNWMTYACVAVLVICIFVQMNFLNRALDVYNTTVVTPIYYVTVPFFGSSSSAFPELFREISTPVKGFNRNMTVTIVINPFINPKISSFDIRTALVYVTICSTLGSFTVMGCKGVGVAYQQTIHGHN